MQVVVDDAMGVEGLEAEEDVAEDLFGEVRGETGAGVERVGEVEFLGMTALFQEGVEMGAHGIQCETDVSAVGASDLEDVTQADDVLGFILWKRSVDGLASTDVFFV